MSNISHRHNEKDQKELRQTLRNNATAAEATLWKALKGKQVEGLKFRRQFGVGPYVLDFYCPELKLAIELDGEVHNSYSAEKHDETRTKFLNENGIEVIRFRNEVVFFNIAGIIEEIKQFQSLVKERRAGCSDHP
ncbi:MAG: endonuclease domain-containing protein [Prevotella sp.]|nr:endonuclease domain-containing protein [Prevotella sp.]